MRDEHRLDLALAKLNGKTTGSLPWGPLAIETTSVNYSAGGRGSPDALLLVKLEFELLGQRISAQIPVLIEAEKAGMDAAMEDLDKFTKRSLAGQPSYLVLPMLVASRTQENSRRTVLREIRARFDIQSVALSVLDP